MSQSDSKNPLAGVAALRRRQSDDQEVVVLDDAQRFLFPAAEVASRLQVTVADVFDHVPLTGEDETSVAMAVGKAEHSL